jgi:D-glycero-alpha-D-manno-heptose 1-phosphate guanylyltransferase
MTDFNQITAVILAGGLGTRLNSVVSDRPKVLAPIEEKPFLNHILDQLIAVGIQHTVLCTGYLGDMVQASFGVNYKTMNLVYSQEPVPLGTGGAIRFAEDLLQSDLILIMNGDSYCRADFNEFLQWHKINNARASLFLTHVPDTGRYGQVKTAENGALDCFIEKGAGGGPGWINAGIYLLDRELITAIPLGRAVSIEKEIFPGLIGHGIYGYQSKCHFIDIGIPEDYAKAEFFFKIMQNS